MNTDDIPISIKNSLNETDCSQEESQGNLYSQNGSHGIGHMSDGNIQDNAKVAGKIDENNNNQTNEIHIHNYPPNNSNIPQEKIDLESNNDKIKLSIKEGNTETSLESPYSPENLKMVLEFLTERFDQSIQVKDIEKGSLRLIIEGSKEGLQNIVNSFQAGELAPLLQQQFNLELEDVRLINSDALENEKQNQSKQLLAFTIAGNVTQSDIDILKAALISTSDNDDEIKNKEKSRLIEEIRSKGAKSRNLSFAYLIGAFLIGAYLIGAYLIGAYLSGAYLIGAYLIGAFLIGAFLIRGFLIRADLIRADLSDAYLIRADLSDAYLIRANLMFAYLMFANLSGADLSDAYLIRAYLIRADLSGANLSGAYLMFANLSGANLSGANLMFANLMFANLSGANLSGANLSGANLSDVNFNGTKVENAHFGYNRGISETSKLDLIARGAIFEDSPGDRSEVLSP